MSSTTIRVRNASRTVGNKVTATVKKLLLIGFLLFLLGCALATGFMLLVAHIVQ